MLEVFNVRGPLSFYRWDKDNEIEVEFDGPKNSTSVYLDRTNIIELRNWLNKQLEKR